MDRENASVPVCLDRRVPTPEEITRHHRPTPVTYVGAHSTTYSLRIEEHDPYWALRYSTLEAEIRANLGTRVQSIQHVGSTSVPGLPAKPIIDIDLSVQDPVDEAAYAAELEALGYVHWLTEPDWHEHRLFKRLDEPRVHLHVFAPDCPEIIRHQMFRDWLLAHPEDRERYAAAKRAAADGLRATGDDQGAMGFGMRYNAVKEPIVHEIYQRMFVAAGLLGASED